MHLCDGITKHKPHTDDVMIKVLKFMESGVEVSVSWRLRESLLPVNVLDIACSDHRDRYRH